VGSGHPAWDGEKLASGTQQLPTITLSGTYPLTLSCVWQGDDTARLSWTPPTQNTDGTTLTNLAGYRLHYGRSADALTNTLEISNPGVSTYVLEELAPGDWFFAVRAYNTLGAESALSNIARKTMTADSAAQEAIALTVNPVPREATDMRVQ
jgi:hypothetical protein